MRLHMIDSPDRRRKRATFSSDEAEDRRGRCLKGPLHLLLHLVPNFDGIELVLNRFLCLEEVPFGRGRGYQDLSEIRADKRGSCLRVDHGDGKQV
jgi:hypothetical protein